MTATVTDRVAAQDASRAAIREALARPEVRDVATSMHLDLSRAAAAIETLDRQRISNRRRTPRARSIEQLVGGASTVVISTTTIIIILLLVIILIIAIK